MQTDDVENALQYARCEVLEYANDVLMSATPGANNVLQTQATRLNECRRKARDDVSKKVSRQARSCKQMQTRVHAGGVHACIVLREIGG
ncbi:hypothetical protein SAMN05443245_1661 [Paraburkholderia fungorum]|uniref:Uncharacterized protein n=1 Tax=Paraburkholderia fungorum TaxID=134537 RepID=A0A1H1BGY7_9BURK|nr:hypothetical protein SAMN05443245_1661 [Paraburkholderia fungorum]